MKKAMAFLVVGGIAFLVDAATYNLLVFWFTGEGPLRDQPLTARIIAILVATIVTYIGNRYWTFSSRHLPPSVSRYVIFVACNVVAIGLHTGSLAFSRYVLGLDDIVADNIFGTFVGQALATVFRYVSYDRWVFKDKSPALENQPAA